MRTFLLCCTLIFVPLAPGQQNPASSKTPASDPQAVQQQMRAIDAEFQHFRAQANQAFAAEMAREKAGECPDATTTYDFNVCFGKAVASTDENFKTYESAIRSLIGIEYPESADAPAPGAAQQPLTPKQQVAEFNRLEDLWNSYATAASTAAFHQFDGGTGGPSFEMETHLRLVRSHMRELDKIYGSILHL